MCACMYGARLAQSVERKALNLVVVGSSPTVVAITHAGLQRCILKLKLVQPVSDLS